MALGSALAGLKELSSSLLAFLTMVDAADPNPSLLPLLSPLGASCALCLREMTLDDVDEDFPSGFVLAGFKCSSPFEMPLVRVWGSSLVLVFLLAGGHSSSVGELLLVPLGVTSCSGLSSAFFFLCTHESKIQPAIKTKTSHTK